MAQMVRKPNFSTHPVCSFGGSSSVTCFLSCWFVFADGVYVTTCWLHHIDNGNVGFLHTRPITCVVHLTTGTHKHYSQVDTICIHVCHVQLSAKCKTASLKFATRCTSASCLCLICIFTSPGRRTLTKNMGKSCINLIGSVMSASY
jgi:hypothetical protein